MDYQINYLLLIIWFIFWLAHFQAICRGLEIRFKLGIFSSSVLAGIIALIPIVNIVAAIWGAIKGWQWKWWLAVCFFVIINVIFIITNMFGVKAITLFIP